jgi:hypothetical protein
VLGTKGFLLDRQEPLLQPAGRVPSCLVEFGELSDLAATVASFADHFTTKELVFRLTGR